MEESSYLAFIVPFALLLLGAGKLLGTDAILAVFIEAAVFGQVIPQREEAEEDKVHDAVSRLLLLPIFILLGMALPFTEWAGLGWAAPVVIAAVVLLRRLVTIWALWPPLKSVHDRPETTFLSWFAPVGVSALFYATLAERHTGNHDVFLYTTLAIAISVLVHGLTSAPFSAWLHHREPAERAARLNRLRTASGLTVAPLPTLRRLLLVGSLEATGGPASPPGGRWRRAIDGRRVGRQYGVASAVASRRT